MLLITLHRITVTPTSTHTVYSTAAGAAAGAAVAMRLVRAPPLILLSSGLSAVTAYSVSGDVSSFFFSFLVLCTYVRVSLVMRLRL